MATAEHVRRVRSCLQIELPSCHFDEEVVEELAQDLVDEEALGKPLELDVLVEHWSPYLIAANACQNFEDAPELCARLQRHLQEQSAETFAGSDGWQPLPEEIQAWLESAGLEHYAEDTRRWCHQKGIASKEAMLEAWESLGDTLPLKKAEKRRFEKIARPRPENAFGPPADPCKYQKLPDLLGRGATAEVYKCVRVDTTVTYAVKIVNLQRSRMDDQLRAKMTDREVTISQQLRHPRIVTLIDVFEDPGVRLYMVMEYVAEGDLFKWITQKLAFQDSLARFVFKQVVEGLQHMHSKNIIHRDLKPENILVEKELPSGDLQVKLSDFGHSKLINEGYGVATTCGVGTPEYLAPEVRNERKAQQGYNHTVDLWSLGVLLYVMLHGVYPFKAGQQFPEGKEVQLGFDNKSLKGRASQDARDLMTKLIVVNPQQRLPLSDCEVHRWCMTPDGSAAPRRR